MERSSSIVDALQGQSPEAHILEASRKTDGFRSGLSSEVVRWSKTGRLCSKDEAVDAVRPQISYILSIQTHWKRWWCWRRSMMGRRMLMVVSHTPRGCINRLRETRKRRYAGRDTRSRSTSHGSIGIRVV
jgi:hypothetical protein